ncbi:MAG: hypothetical protein U1F17_02105 [Burkholderiaceae bacterium]
MRQYYALADPTACATRTSLADVHKALASNNANSGGGILPQGPTSSSCAASA